MDRVETKGDYVPKIQSFSSVLQEIPLKNSLRRYASLDDNLTAKRVNNDKVIDWVTSNHTPGFDEDHEEEEGGDKSMPEDTFLEVSDDSGSDGSSVGTCGAFDIVTNTTDLNDLSQSHASLLSLVPSPASPVPREITSPHEKEQEYRLDYEDIGYSVDDDDLSREDHIIQFFTSFDYHGEEDDGVQL